MYLARLEQVLDAGLVDQHALSPYAHLDDAAVIPLEEAMHLLAVLQHYRHVGLLLNLLLKIKSLRMRALDCRPAFLHGMRQRVFAVGIVPAFACGKPRAYKL